MAQAKRLSVANDTTPTIGNRSGPSDAIIEIEGTWTGTITFEAKVEDAVLWFPIGLTPVAGGAVSTTAAANGIWRTVNGGASGLEVRGRLSTATSGTAETSVASADW